MSTAALPGIDLTVQQTHIWIGELQSHTGWADRQRVYRLLRATLQALRDQLPVEEVADLGAQLPLLIRGLYDEGWRPAGTAGRSRSKEDFLARIGEAFRADPMGDAEVAVGAALGLLTAHISKGEMDDVRQALPKQIRQLIPA